MSKLSLISLSLAAALAGTPAPAAEKFQQAQDMRYGESLYHYFQGNNFDALSALMVAETRGELRRHADNAALIEGGISLAFGLENRAAQLFEQQLQKADGDDATLAGYRATAWRKLAELNYRHQNWETSREQLEKSGAASGSDLALNLALRTGDLQQAAQLLADKDLKNNLKIERRALGHINLAAALARAENFPEAINHYRRAARLAGSEESAADELRILRDKAHMGAGYALALQQQYAAASEEFRQVRLRTAWADRALLGMGWSSINSGAYQSAVDALQFLIEQSPLSPEVQEALVALPYSYEKLARPKAALLSYQQAERQYASALAELHGLQSTIQDLELTGEQPGWKYGWLETAEAPQLIRDNRRYLKRLLQSDQFQLRLSDLRDLRQLQQVLEKWRERAPLFDQLIVERQQRRKTVVDNYSSAQFDQQLQIAEQQYRQLANELARIAHERDGLALLQGEDSELLQRVERAQNRYATLATLGKARPRQAETLQRAQGILLWQASESYHDNLWQQRKILQTLSAQLETAAQQRQQVDQTAARAPQLRQLQARLGTAQSRLDLQQRAIATAAEIIEESIRRDVIAELQREQQRISRYVAHTRLAIARLYDSAMRDDGKAQP